jgi:hypothetical protein
MSEGKAEILRMFQLALLVTVTWVLAMKGWALSPLIEGCKAVSVTKYEQFKSTIWSLT